MPDRRRYPADQATTADTHQDGPQAGDLLGDLEPDRALPGDHGRIVEGMHQQPAVLERGGLGRQQSGVDPAVHMLDPRAEAAGARDLDRARAGRNEDRSRDAEVGRRVRDALGVVSGTGSDHAPRPHGGVGKSDAGECAA